MIRRRRGVGAGDRSTAARHDPIAWPAEGMEATGRGIPPRRGRCTLPVGTKPKPPPLANHPSRRNEDPARATVRRRFGDGSSPPSPEKRIRSPSAPPKQTHTLSCGEPNRRLGRKMQALAREGLGGLPPLSWCFSTPAKATSTRITGFCAALPSPSPDSYCHSCCIGRGMKRRNRLCAEVPHRRSRASI